MILPQSNYEKVGEVPVESAFCYPDYSRLDLTVAILYPTLALPGSQPCWCEGAFYNTYTHLELARQPGRRDLYV